MAWNLQGRYLESCNCDVVCPCAASFSLAADNERCQVVLAFHIDSGEIDGTDVSGLTVALVADTPQVMKDGNWRVGALIDEAASEEQAGKLGAVFSGQLGGPPAALGPLIGENLGAEQLPMEFDSNGTHRLKAGDDVELEVENVVPFGKESSEPVKLVGVFSPASTELTIAQAKTGRVNVFGIEYEAKSAVTTSFSWSA
jgi:hypothetical protein